MTLTLEAKPTGVAVIAECDLKMEGCTALTPAPVTVVNVGPSQDQYVVCRSCLGKMVREGEWSVQNALVAPQTDFLLVDELKRPMIAVDVRGVPRTRAVDVEQWGAGLRRNLIAHGAIPDVKYFLLLVVPSLGFLWSSPPGFGSDAPDYSFTLDQLTSAAETIPEENGPRAESWAEAALTSLLHGRLHPTGLWWTESGLQRTIEGDSLSLVKAARSKAS